MDTTKPLEGQVAVVTGGGRGLGRAFAATLAGAGASVAVLARSPEELAETVAAIHASGGQARAFAVDVTDAADVRAAIAAVELSLGPVDLLVNNAGWIGPIGPFWEIEPETWWRAMDVNLRGSLLCAHAVLPGMVARRSGRIVNIATTLAPFAYLSSYMCSKAALVRAMECLAAEAKPHGVAIFSIAPGTVRTAMSSHSLNSLEGREWLPWYRRIFDEGLDVPAERPAALVLALASGAFDELSGLFLTVFDDLPGIAKEIDRVRREQLHSLRVRSLTAGRAPAPLAAIRAAAERAKE
ncbi:MAG TPA: SDR family oxidoreductase [Candidatus Sulfopaludibacter sp.]|nr:SDR family oxidoreductase [Candidatus Sulfopaludibacter sp.]